MHDPTARHREIAVKPLARLDLVVITFLDRAKSPDGHAAPAFGACRKEFPVLHGIAENGIGDVVFSQREAIHAHQDFAIPERLFRQRNDA